MRNTQVVAVQRQIIDRERDHQKWRTRMLFLHGAIVAAPVVLSFVRTRLQINAMGICVFKYIFGVDCPGCGITHSAMAMFSGDMGEAFRIHPAGPVMVGINVLMTLYLAVALVTRYGKTSWRKEVMVYSGLEIGAAVALLAGWGVRLITS